MHIYMYLSFFQCFAILCHGGRSAQNKNKNTLHAQPRSAVAGHDAVLSPPARPPYLYVKERLIYEAAAQAAGPPAAIFDFDIWPLMYSSICNDTLH